MEGCFEFFRNSEENLGKHREKEKRRVAAEMGKRGVEARVWGWLGGGEGAAFLWGRKSR